MIYIFNMNLGAFYWCKKDEKGSSVFDWVYSIKEATAVKKEHLKENHLKSIKNLEIIEEADKGLFD